LPFSQIYDRDIAKMIAIVIIFNLMKPLAERPVHTRPGYLAAFKSNRAVLVRKSKPAQERIWTIHAHNVLYAVVRGELEMFHKGSWRSTPSQTVHFFRRDAIMGIRQKASFRGRVEIICTSIPPEQCAPPIFACGPLVLSNHWWLQFLNVEGSCEYDEFGQRVVAMDVLKKFLGMLNSSFLRVRNSESQKSAPPVESSTAANWMEIWARACELINLRARKGLTVRQLCDELGVSPTLLRNAFHLAEGRSPKSAMTRWRMAEAKRLILMRRWQMKEIARKVGFSTVQRFSAAFKSFCRQSPRQFGREKDQNKHD
jgi:AraC-like DNA-binding protein